ARRSAPTAGGWRRRRGAGRSRWSPPDGRGPGDRAARTPRRGAPGGPPDAGRAPPPGRDAHRRRRARPSGSACR
ncbi:MAG TPA: hypothetical protein DD490_28525, partial [Acidobacteria bacterium]|nr:hypothetical protein [Acidobacteriota bacterium]